jgi:hypothetical protein
MELGITRALLRPICFFKLNHPDAKTFTKGMAPMIRTTCAFVALLHFVVPAALGQADNRVLVVSKDSTIHIGQLIKPTSVTFKYIDLKTKDPDKITPVKGTIAIGNLLALTFSGNAAVALKDPNMTFGEFKKPSNADLIISTGKTYLFYGEVTTTTFQVQPDSTDPAKSPSELEVILPSTEIRAIYFLRGIPKAASADGKSTPSGKTSSTSDEDADPYNVYIKRLIALRYDARRLHEDYIRICGKLEEMDYDNNNNAFLGTLHQLQDPSERRDLAMQRLAALQSAYRLRQIEINGVEMFLTYLKKPLPGSYGASANIRSHSLYVMDGAHYGQMNDFGDGPYLSSSNYAKVLPGMKLTVSSDGYWKLEYRMLTMSYPAHANWELKIRYLDEFGSPREIPLQTFPRRIYQTKDTDTTIQNVSHSGSHPAIQEFFSQIRTTGRLSRTGHVRFETDNGDLAPDIASN